jgi:hypothetical protein
MYNDVLDISLIQSNTALMPRPLPTAKELRAKISAERREAETQRLADYKQALELLFGKANGRQKRLPMKEQLFIRAIKHRSYEGYIDRLRKQASGEKKIQHYPHTLLGPQISFKKWVRRWYAAAKGKYHRYVVPKQAKERLEAIHACSDSPMP